MVNDDFLKGNSNLIFTEIAQFGICLYEELWAPEKKAKCFFVSAWGNLVTWVQRNVLGASDLLYTAVSQEHIRKSHGFPGLVLSMVCL